MTFIFFRDFRGVGIPPTSNVEWNSRILLNQWVGLYDSIFWCHITVDGCEILHHLKDGWNPIQASNIPSHPRCREPFFVGAANQCHSRHQRHQARGMRSSITWTRCYLLACLGSPRDQQKSQRSLENDGNMMGSWDIWWDVLRCRNTKPTKTIDDIIGG